MEFSQLLDNYIKKIGCSAKELAAHSDISASVISRYRSGERAPSPDSDILRNLATGISALSDLDYETVYNQLMGSLTSRNAFAKQAFYKIDKLVSELYIKQADIARTFNYDASFISRVLSGQRFPSDVEGFLNDISRYISKVVNTKDGIMVLSNIIIVPVSDLGTENERFSAIYSWLNHDDTPTINFLNTLDNFDYNSFLTDKHFDDVKIPSEPFQLPSRQIYIGIDRMKQGEIDFMKSTALSRSSEDVFFYSDMTMMDMIDSDFLNKYMIGLAVLIRKGLKLNVIHNLSRPLEEIFIGLETWIPLYMTGQISPYVFNDYSDQIFSHMLYCSGTTALYGSSLYGQRNQGHYFLTRDEEDISYFKDRSKNMLRLASPLMKIYRSNDAKTFYNEIDELLDSSSSFRSILLSPPITSISNALLEKIVRNYAKTNNLTKERTLQILKLTKTAIKNEKNMIKKVTRNNTVSTSFRILSKEEFDSSPIYLPLSMGFLDISIPYTYETYMEHVDLTKQFINQNKNFSMEEPRSSTFKNIQIRIGTKDDTPWVLITKTLSPSIHFLIKNPILVNALSKI